MRGKHFLLFFLFITTIVGCVIFYRYFIVQQIILKQLITVNQKIALQYQQQVLNSFDINSIFKNILNKEAPTEGLRDKENNKHIQFLKFAHDSFKYFERLNAQITLFDSKGRAVLACDKYHEYLSHYPQKHWLASMQSKINNYFLNETFVNDPLQRALSGSNQFVILQKDFRLHLAKSEELLLIQSFIPIIDKDFRIQGVLRVTNNTYDEWLAVNEIETRLLFCFGFVVLFLCAIYYYNIFYTYRIINLQLKDARQLKTSRDEMELHSMAQSSFFANLSHELRTPLNTIIGFSEITLSKIKNTTGNVEQYREYLENIHSAGKHLLAMINDILDFTKASSDKLSVELIEVDINKVITSSIRFLEPKIQECKLSIIMNLEKEHAIIQGDPKRLKQVILNILSNAIKFTPEKGSIVIELKRVTKSVVLSITDSGIGMSEKDIPKALSPFLQINNQLNRKYDGTGLGLPLSKKLVEMMNGHFAIESKKGKGTKITISFETAVWMSYTHAS
ncbi:Two-component sensor histidine kinase [Rickettsiales endosymbiont of Paramecium tredecaurelia]|uniref:sensor histidine kinase n=1 Tax=Candidatus Sarmatiella mevalonica TaxID=2770581 RepID=UPI0019214DBA|nr:HAMP domain-containing sensor histidine kinase [Candidatus Sarmatiella mevalonica]MBL3284737.1 Two-component sensor histidine kinase [Candidatus Sarmatiella mevalonica]